MKYTKEQLIGAIFKWGTKYTVIWNHDKSDVMLEGADKVTYKSYNTFRLNKCIENDKNCIFSIPNKQLNYEIY